MSEAQALLGAPTVVDWSKAPLWKLAHALGFATGGVTFVLGTLCFFPEHYEWATGFLLSAILYIVGSVGCVCVRW